MNRYGSIAIAAHIPLTRVAKCGIEKLHGLNFHIPGTK